MHQYGFEQLEHSLSLYIQSILSLANVCIIYDTACLYKLNNLREHCALFIDNHANEIVKTNEFHILSSVSCLVKIIVQINLPNKLFCQAIRYRKCS